MNKDKMDDPFLKGNELIEKAIDRLYEERSGQNLTGVLEAIRQRMHADGHFMIPVGTGEKENEFLLRNIRTKDGKEWVVAFTSPAEHEKGESERIISDFMDSVMKHALNSDCAGIAINPWGRPFFLEKELVRMIFKADGDEEYAVPDDPITAELLEDGSFLKRAAGICNRNRTQLNIMKLMRVLRDSLVWIPCNAIMSDVDRDKFLDMVREADGNGELESLAGKTISNEGTIRMVPDILKNGDEFFFPVFSSVAEMGEYGENFSKVQKHFLEAATLARNNEREVKGIVINAFSEPFVVPVEMFDLVAAMDSALDAPEGKTE